MSAGSGAGAFSSGAGSFNAGAASGLGGGAASSDDPYANIAIDLSKVKAAPVASKPFEAKTEEEKNQIDHPLYEGKKMDISSKELH